MLPRDFAIRKPREELNEKIGAMEATLNEMIEDPRYQEQRVRIQELKRDHRLLKGRFLGFTKECSKAPSRIHDTWNELRILKREYELVEHRCSNLMIEVLEAGRKERQVTSCVSGNVAGLKEDGESKKSSLSSGKIDVIKEVKESHEDWDAVKDTGASLSRLLVRLTIILSECVQVVDRLQIFKSKLESMEAYEENIVVNKFNCLLKFTEREIKYNKILEEGKIDDKENVMDGSLLQELLDKFLGEICRWEFTLKDYGSKMLKDGSLKARLKESEDELKALEMKVNELGTIHGAKQVHESFSNAMELKINKIWTQLEEPMEEPQGSGH